MVEIDSKTERVIDDIALTRDACYLNCESGELQEESVSSILEHTKSKL
jgi:hypothetical protein